METARKKAASSMAVGGKENNSIPGVHSQQLSLLKISCPNSPYLCCPVGFLGSSMVKNPPAMQEMQETWVQSLGWEDPLEEGMVTHSSILAWRIPWTEEAGGLQFVGSQSQTRLKQLSMHTPCPTNLSEVS